MVAIRETDLLRCPYFRPLGGVSGIGHLCIAVHWLLRLLLLRPNTSGLGSDRRRIRIATPLPLPHASRPGAGELGACIMKLT